ncbi:unnamed protein product [Callosobruchus maculatus]|uniref:Uncharacterized protein n=1 Tax=Callosobruchus maculatus TaxID=64391 RepID=A0A653DD20_CALMS|nr:unnamed protein product [Callosobruchus maculatus]
MVTPEDRLWKGGNVTGKAQISNISSFLNQPSCYLCYHVEYDDTMPPKRSREEILRRKREAEKTRMLKIKNDPIKLPEYKEKEKQKYLKKIEKGQRKRINQMTDREKRSTRRKWREYSSTYRQKKVVEHHTENFMRETTPPLSDNEPHRENIPHIAEEEYKRRKEGVGNKGSFETDRLNKRMHTFLN